MTITRTNLDKLLRIVEEVANVDPFLTVAQLGVLAAVGARSGRPMNDIWELVSGITYSAASRVIYKLISLKLVDHSAQGGDRRMKLLFLTPRGEHLLQKIAEHMKGK